MERIIIIALLFISSVCFAQTKMVAYSRDYEFTEGVFLTAEQFKQNGPVPKSAIVSAYPKTQVDFMKQVMDSKYITCKVADGSEQKIETSTVWGYCQNRTIYLNFNNGFNRLNVIGTLCHLTAAVTVQMGYRDPMNTYGINTQDEIRQFVLNTKTNKIVDFNVNNMELILQDDPGLYTEFMKLKKRKKADSIFVYLRSYNEKHPLYLPVK